MKITIVGHSTTLIEIAGLKILTDPFFRLRGNFAYARTGPPAIDRQDLTNVNLVLVSHNHFDHVDRKFFRALPPETPVVTPSLTSWMFRIMGAQNIRGIKAWHTLRFSELSITAVPAWHSANTAGFVIEAGHETIYFAGDTYFGRFMEKIGRELRPSVVLMPVATFRVPMTMGEKGALAAAAALNPRVIIPIHLGLRPRSPLLRTRQSPEHFKERLRNQSPNTEVVILHSGESWASD